MLVLTRKYQEKVRIGDNITITVLRTKGKAVRLGIEAPAEVSVIRGELAFEAAEPNATASAPEAAAAVIGGNHTRSRVASAATSWTTDSPKVAHKRVPRDQVAEVLPKLVSGSAPLRAIMDQR